MEDNKDKVAATETADANTNDQGKVESSKVEKTYTRAEVEAIKKAERDAITKKYDDDKAEADKIAKMKDDEQKDYRLKKVESERDEANKKYTELLVKTRATEYATEVGLPLSFLPKSYEGETDDTITKKIDDMYKDFNSALEKDKNKRLKETPPRTVGSGTEPKKEVSRMSI